MMVGTYTFEQLQFCSEKSPQLDHTLRGIHINQMLNAGKHVA